MDGSMDNAARFIILFNLKIGDSDLENVMKDGIKDKL